MSWPVISGGGWSQGPLRPRPAQQVRWAGVLRRFGTQPLAAWVSLTCPQFSTPQMHAAVDLDNHYKGRVCRLSPQLFFWNRPCGRPMGLGN